MYGSAVLVLAAGQQLGLRPVSADVHALLHACTAGGDLEEQPRQDARYADAIPFSRRGPPPFGAVVLCLRMLLQLFPVKKQSL